MRPTRDVSCHPCVGVNLCHFLCLLAQWLVISHMFACCCVALHVSLCMRCVAWCICGLLWQVAFNTAICMCTPGCYALHATNVTAYVWLVGGAVDGSEGRTCMCSTDPRGAGGVQLQAHAMCGVHRCHAGLATCCIMCVLLVWFPTCSLPPQAGWFAAGLCMCTSEGGLMYCQCVSACVWPACSVADGSPGDAPQYVLNRAPAAGGGVLQACMPCG